VVIFPLSPQISREIVPGVLPCTSTSYGEVTIASAMSGVDSETRVIGRSMWITVERPTMRSSIRGAPAPATAPTAFSARAALCARAIGGSTMRTIRTRATA
jgi:hypothetical protein